MKKDRWHFLYKNKWFEFILSLWLYSNTDGGRAALQVKPSHQEVEVNVRLSVLLRDTSIQGHTMQGLNLQIHYLLKPTTPSIQLNMLTKINYKLLNDRKLHTKKKVMGESTWTVCVQNNLIELKNFIIGGGDPEFWSIVAEGVRFAQFQSSF